MLKPQLAVGDFKKILAIDPNNKSVKLQLEATQKLVRKIEFEKVGQHRDPVTLRLSDYAQAIEREEEMSAVLRCLEIIADGWSKSHTPLFYTS